MSVKRKKDFWLESLPGDTMKIDKSFWQMWPFDELYEMVGRGLKKRKNHAKKPKKLAIAQKVK